MAKQQRRKAENTTPIQNAAPQDAGDTTGAAVDRDRVAQRAYELYLERGCQEGGDLDDWLCAERELAGRGQERTQPERRDQQRNQAQGSGDERNQTDGGGQQQNQADGGRQELQHTDR